MSSGARNPAQRSASRRHREGAVDKGAARQEQDQGQGGEQASGPAGPEPGQADRAREPFDLQHDAGQGPADFVVEFTGDTCSFFDDRLARGDVALTFSDLRAAFSIADHPPDEQHHDDADDRKERCAGEAQRRPERGEKGASDEHDQTEHEPLRRRPDREPVQAAKVGDARGDDLRVGDQRQLQI